MELEYEILVDKVYVYTSFDTIILEIPLYLLLDFVEVEELNHTGDIEKDFFEQRNELGGFDYISIDVAIKEDSLKYLQNNTEETVVLYLKQIIKDIPKKRKKR